MTFINKKLNNKIEIVVGKLNLNSNIDKAWSDLSIDFLNAVYLEINKNSSNRKYSDLITFGFWCRKSNLNNLKLNYQNKYKMFGRGNVLHITPSNASMNFAFSLAMGLLSGNSNIVRLPNRVFLQTKILCNIIKKLIKNHFL